jgi:V8-like Glu-specific endopeptidase
MKALIAIGILNLLIGLTSLVAFGSDFPMLDVKQVLSQQSQPRLEQIAKATAALLRTDDDHFLNPKKFGDIYKFCSEEKFLEQNLFSYCSGTLIAKNKILTAGHCVRSLKDCSDIRIAFDYFENADIPKIQSGKILKCKKISAWSKPVSQVQLIDYAVIELEQDVLDRQPIVMSNSLQNSQQQDRIYSVGHPLGLPMKLVQGYFNSADKKADLLTPRSAYRPAHMNSHPGLSGSGVYNENLELSGILVRGEANIERDGMCSRIRTCDTQDCPWVHIQKLPKLK